MKSEVCVVMPVYNEGLVVHRVIDEWVSYFRSKKINFSIIALNDGSRDSTPQVLDAMKAQFPELRVVHKSNSGHGQSCLEGYRLAAQNGSEWIFQIDSDGQCDPKYFEEFWKVRHEFQALYGNRQTRDDGWLRSLISKLLRLAIFVRSGKWIQDANCPYRLFRTEGILQEIVSISPQLDLANIGIAAVHVQTRKIQWIAIGFRNRFAGKSHASFVSMAKKLLNLWAHFPQIVPAVKSSRVA